MQRIRPMAGQGARVSPRSARAATLVVGAVLLSGLGLGDLPASTPPTPRGTAAAAAATAVLPPPAPARGRARSTNRGTRVSPGGSPSREQVVASWPAYQAGSAVTSGWTGDIAGCQAGTTDPGYQQATLARLNWFRWMVGLAPVELDPAKSAQAQQAALMMAAANTLSHTPTSGWPCYTEVGGAAAGASNLFLGLGRGGAGEASVRSAGAAAVTGYIDDPGADNAEVGHRRWLLYPRLTTVGSGDVVAVTAQGWRATNALYVFGDWATPDQLPAFVAWPTAGYMPRTVMPGSGRWSFSIPRPKGTRQADFRRASVSVVGPDGVHIPTTVVSSDTTPYGDNALIWTVPDLGLSAGMAEATYQVTVSGVRNIPGRRVFSYQLTVLDL